MHRAGLAPAKAIGALVGSLVAEVADPLAVIETSAYLALRYRNAPAKADKHLERIGEQMQIASSILQKIAGLAREPLPSNEEISLTAELAHIVEELDRRRDPLSLSATKSPPASDVDSRAGPSVA